MSPIKVADAKREEGFTLIELLVVVLIIGILAAIAIPAFLGQRQRAWESELTSGIRNTALEVEAAAVQQGGNYLDVVEIDDAAAAQLLLADTIGAGDVSILVDPTRTAANFCIQGSHALLLAAGEPATVTYNTANNGVGDIGSTCTAP